MCVLSQLFLDMLYNHMNYKNNIHSIQFQYMLDPQHHDELNHDQAFLLLLHFHSHILHMYEVSVILFLHSYIHASDLLYHLTNQQNMYVLAFLLLLHFHSHIHYMFASCFHLLYVLLPLLLQIHHMYELLVILFLHSYIHASDLLYHLTNQQNMYVLALVLLLHFHNHIHYMFMLST